MKMSVVYLRIILLFYLLSGGVAVANSYCTQLLFEFDFTSSLTVMAPVVSINERYRVEKDFKVKSKSEGYKSYFGVSFLEDLIKDRPGATFRFVQNERISSNQIKLYLFQGTVAKFQNRGAHALVLLEKKGARQWIRVEAIDEYYILENLSPPS